MKILIIADEVWNDRIHGSNVLTNWFQGFNAEFAEIYCSPGAPQNECCEHYFQLTDAMMAKSILPFGASAGVELSASKYKRNAGSMTKAEPEHKKLYSILKSVTTEPLRLVRDLIWLWGKYDRTALDAFIDREKPDVIFCPRLATVKMMRLENYVHQHCSAPMIAYTGDNETSIGVPSKSPVSWVRTRMVRKNFDRQIQQYALYYMHSEEQAWMYHEQYGISTKTLYKCGTFEEKKVHQKVNNPIRLVYIGKLYCNRWKTLGLIADGIRQINGKYSKPQIVLEIYTKDKITHQQEQMLNDRNCSFIMGGIAPENIPVVYEKSDVVLHVESFDKKQKNITRFSFSTKVVDCLASGCALWTIGWEKHCACQYLKKFDCAMVTTEPRDIFKVLQNMVECPQVILEYAQKAYNHGEKYLSREKVQNKLMKDFSEVIAESKRSTDGEIYENNAD